MAYSMDSSGFLDAWVRRYPPDMFGSTVWRHMGEAARSGKIVVSDEVVRELEKKDDGAAEWIRKHSGMIIATDETIQREVRDILAKFPRLVDTRKNRSGGDPFVIAVAHLLGYTVVTGELPSGNPAKPHIPDACANLKVACVNVLDFFREQKWKDL